MTKNEKMKTTKLEKNPFMYYVTNWGFVEQGSQKINNHTKNQKRS
ncbi:hypothetical protein BC792_1141 [Sphingobacterium allocomposti]|uniref:Uncharacterized protein n=1 Tax=Sphingobacterium allocomposti TaxID=415956 RepID=A0A5S5DAT8_9SPHI|nr:hypothetical protein BC792_1141 [Sphingobacterium composti Yoo et al. 2007 non Ten et al. 2007]